MKTKLTNDREELMEIKLAITRPIPTIPITKGLADGLAIRKELQKIMEEKK